MRAPPHSQKDGYIRSGVPFLPWAAGKRRFVTMARSGEPEQADAPTGQPLRAKNETHHQNVPYHGAFHTCTV